MPGGRRLRRSPSSEREESAARAVQRVIGGTWHLHDTGAENDQVDILFELADGRRVALEHTSEGGGVWRQTADRIRQAVRRGESEGQDLRWQWLVVVPSGIGIRELQPDLEWALGSLEEAGQANVSVPREPAAGDSDAVNALRRLRVRSVHRFDEHPARGEPKILVVQSDSRIGTAGALPAALGRVLEKRDNQLKLAAAEVDERHLFVFLEDGNASAVLQQWPLPASPADPAAVIDTIWVFSPFASAYLFKVAPGADRWRRFVEATGEER